MTLVALGVSSIIFDGLSQTRPFFDLFGAPDLIERTLLLFGFLAIVVLLSFAVARTVGYGAIGAGLLPIAVGYLIAHYLTYLLIDGQRILIAISDPFNRGWNLFGTAFHEPTGAWLPPGLVWTVQLAAVVGRAHAGGVGRACRGRGRRAGRHQRRGPATAPDPARGRDDRADDADAVVARSGDHRVATGLRARPARPAAGTHDSSERTSPSWAAMAGSSASAAATAVSIAVRHRMPSAVAEWRISAASRTAPERGVGVLTTSRTSPEAIRSRMATSPSASEAASPSLATGRAS